jgi:hypothetical protein
MAVKSKLLLINSWASSSGGVPTNFSQPLAKPLSGVRGVHFLNFSCPNIMPPFANFGKTFYVQVDGNTSTTYSVTIDTSRFFSTVADFVTYINGLFAAHPAPRLRQITFSFSSTTLKLTMSDLGGTCRPLPYAPGGNECGYRIGFPETSYAFQAAHVATGYPAVILRTDQIKVHINLIGSTSSAFQADADCIYAVPVDTNVGELINYSNPYVYTLPCHIDNLSEVSIRLTDQDNQELSLPNNAYVSLSLMLDIAE